MTVDPLAGVSPQTRQEANSAKNAEVREWRCVCSAWNPMRRAFCGCGKFWQRSEFGGRLVVR